MATVKKSTRPVREAMFVQIQEPGGLVKFHNATSFIGKTMPFTKPKATCAMSVSDESVAFSLLTLTKAKATKAASEALTLPRTPLTELARKARSYGKVTVDENGVESVLLEDGELIVEHKVEAEDGTPSKNVYKLNLKLDANGVAELEMKEGEDHAFELPKRDVKFGAYFKSPKVGRVIALSFIGFTGKPGDNTTITQAVSKFLYSISLLPEFRVLTGIQGVKVPSPVSSFQNRPVAGRKLSDKADVSLDINFFAKNAGEPQPVFVAKGSVGVEVDLETANPQGDRFLYKYTPSKEVAEVFEDYRGALDRALSEAVLRDLGSEDISNLLVEIVLGGLSSSDVQRIREALSSVQTGIMLTPSQHQLPAQTARV